MTARDRLNNIGKVVDDDQDPSVFVVRGAEFYKMVLDQLIEIAAWCPKASLARNSISF